MRLLLSPALRSPRLRVLPNRWLICCLCCLQLRGRKETCRRVKSLELVAIELWHCHRLIPLGLYRLILILLLLVANLLLLLSVLDGPGCRRHRGLRRRLGSWSEWYRRCLRHRPPTRHGLCLFYLKLNSGISSCLLTVSLILLIYVEYQLLHMIACDCVLIKVSRADAQVKRLIALLLSGTFLEARSLAS